MPRPLISVLALAGILLWSFLLSTGGHHIRDRGEATQGAGGGDIAALSADDSAEAEAILSQGTAEADAPEPALESRAVRPATSGDAATAETGAQPLERIAPREQPTPPPAAPAKPLLLTRPVTVQAGLVTVAGRKLGFAGLLPTDPQRRCQQADGKDWPCGALAATAQRQFIRGRTIACDLKQDWADGSAATCRIGDIDIGAWLAAGGWAEASPGSGLEDAVAAARKAGKGLFGPDPRQSAGTAADPP